MANSTTVTNEKLKEYAKASEEQFPVLSHRAIAEMAQRLLAAESDLLAVREAQSVPAYYVLVDGDDYEFNSHNEFSCGRRGGTPLFTAPPAPAVPDAIEPTYEAIKAILPTANPDEYACCVGADMWNACRVAMLKNEN